MRQIYVPRKNAWDFDPSWPSNFISGKSFPQRKHKALMPQENSFIIRKKAEKDTEHRKRISMK